MKTAIIMMRNILTAIAVMLLIAGCSGSSTTASSETGSITAKLVWSEAKTTAKTLALAPVGVTMVRFIISGSGMTTVQQDFAAATGTGTIGSVLAGTGRTFTAQGLNSSGTVTHQGSVSNITVQPGQNTDVGIITMLPLNPPTAPSGLTVSVVSSSQINLAWTDSSSDETGFKIERKTGSGGTYAQIGTAATNAISYSDTGLVASTVYYYRVRATNGAGDSGYSIEANATTAASGGVGGTGTIQLPKTGQTTSYAAGDDGALLVGVSLPKPRFTDNNNGTVTDNLTGLVWLKNASCFGSKTWNDAIATANSLASGTCGLTDGSSVGNWRLPNRKELFSIIDFNNSDPALPTGHPFVIPNDPLRLFWSSSTHPYASQYAFLIIISIGHVSIELKNSNIYLWPVR